MIIMDTCALLWQSFEPEKLSAKASKAIDSSQEILLSSISIWEVGIKLKSKKLSIPLKLSNYVERVKKVDRVRIIPADETTWVDSIDLAWDHTDPADRVIVATAKRLAIPIVTADKEMKKFYKKVIW